MRVAGTGQQACAARSVCFGLSPNHAPGKFRAQVEDRFAVGRLTRLPKRLKRVFELGLERCPNSGGELKITAAIREQPEIEKILTRLGLQARAPPRSPQATQPPGPLTSAAYKDLLDRWKPPGDQG